MRNYTEQTGVAFLTSDQRSWLELRRTLRQASPSKRPVDRPDSTWRTWCYQRATTKSGKWHRFMTSVLVVHLIALLLESHPSPPLLDFIRGKLPMYTYMMTQSRVDDIRSHFCYHHLNLGRQLWNQNSWANLVAVSTKSMGHVCITYCRMRAGLDCRPILQN